MELEMTICSYRVPEGIHIGFLPDYGTGPPVPYYYWKELLAPLGPEMNNIHVLAPLATVNVTLVLYNYGR